MRLGSSTPEYYQLLPEDKRASLTQQRENLVKANNSAEVDRIDYFAYKLVTAEKFPMEEIATARDIVPAGPDNPIDKLMVMLKANPMIAAGAALGILFLFMRKKRA